MNQLTVRNKIAALESAMMSLPQAEISVSHAACGNMKARTIFIAAGTVLVGAIHLQEQLNIVFGDITIVTEEGERRYTGYHVLTSPIGTKRVGHAHADTYWTTILETDEEDPEKIKENLTVNRFDDPRLLDKQPIEMIGE